MDIAAVFHEYGWAVAILLWLMQIVWPQAFSFFTRAKQAELDSKIKQIQLKQESDMDARRKEIDSKLELLKAQSQIELEASREEREARRAERNFRHELDQRATINNEKLTAVIAAQTELHSRMAEQLVTISNNLNSLSSYMVNYTQRMTATVNNVVGQIQVNTDDIRIVKQQSQSIKPITGPLTGKHDK